MWITPWRNGAPDPVRAQRVAYLGPDVRVEHWLPHGTYVAIDGFSRYHAFAPLGDSPLELPDPWWTRGDVIAGGWWEDGRVAIELSGGFDLTSRVSPHAAIASRMHLSGNFVPLVEARAAVAANQDDVVATRLGGLTPYHVPLAGAAWAEFWVEDYAMTRAGLQWRLGPFSLAQVVDAGVWTYPKHTLLPDSAGQAGRGGARGHRRGRRERLVRGPVGRLRPRFAAEGRGPDRLGLRPRGHRLAARRQGARPADPPGVGLM